MARSGNRKASAGRPRRRVGADGKRPAPRKKSRAKSAGKRTANRKVKPGARVEAVPMDPQEFKTRNRTLLVVAILALVNLYVFVLRGDGLDRFKLSASIGNGQDAQGVAAPLENACGSDPVRIFEGLEDMLPVGTALSRGRTLRLGLLELGVGADQIDAVEAAVRTHVDLGLLAGSGAPLRVAMDREGGVAALEIELAEGHVVQACRDRDHLEVRNLQHPLRSDVAVVAFTVPRDGDLVGALKQAGEHADLARPLAAALAHDVDVQAETRPGDEIQLIVEKRFLGRFFHRYGPILAVRYKGAGGFFAYYYYKPKSMDAGYFNGYGEPRQRTLLRSPVGYHPLDPELRGTLAPTVEIVDGRPGAIYRRPEGTPVVALADGQITDITRHERDGLAVEVRHPDGTTVRYGHLMRVLGELHVGQDVRQGQTFALVGHTGQARFNGLRTEIMREGELLDPMTPSAHGDQQPDRVGAKIPEPLLEQFKRDVAGWRRAMRSAAR